jgi:hypothetical protein
VDAQRTVVALHVRRPNLLLVRQVLRPQYMAPDLARGGTGAGRLPGLHGTGGARRSGVLIGRDRDWESNASKKSGGMGGGKGIWEERGMVHEVAVVRQVLRPRYMAPELVRGGAGAGRLPGLHDTGGARRPGVLIGQDRDWESTRGRRAVGWGRQRGDLRGEGDGS